MTFVKAVTEKKVLFVNLWTGCGEYLGFGLRLSAQLACVENVNPACAQRTVDSVTSVKT